MGANLGQGPLSWTLLQPDVHPPPHGAGLSDGQQVQKGPRPHCRRHSLSVGPRADNRAKGPQVAQGAHRLFPLARPCLCPAASCLSWSCLWVSCWLRLLRQSRAQVLGLQGRRGTRPWVKLVGEYAGQVVEKGARILLPLAPLSVGPKARP